LEAEKLTITNVWVRKELIAIEIAHLPISDFFKVVITSFAIHCRDATSTICGAHVDNARVLDIRIILPKR
jgi:hypothetical protein